MPIPFLNQIDLAKLTTAVTPDSSAVSLYAKSDDNLYIKKSNGTELQLLTSLDVGGISGTTNYIPKFTAANQLGNSIIYETGGKIGIGTTAPSVTLDVNGQIRSRSATGTAPLIITSTTKVSNLNVDYLDDQHGSFYLDWNNFTNKPTSFPPSAHNHDDRYFTETESDARFAPIAHDHSGVYQPLDADLTAIAGLTGTSGLLKKTAANTWVLDTTTYLTGTKVDSFNTRTGAVTLTKADVEGVLTGVITSHTHNYTNNTGTVTSVAMTVPTGLSVSGSPITTSGTLALSFASGYSIPTTAKQAEWDLAYYHSTLPHYEHWRVRVNSETGGLDVINNTGVNFIAGTNVTISRSGGDITIDASGGGGSGVTSFNTRTGDVTLLQADVEAVLTGNINTHTHDTYVLKAGDTMTGNLLIHKIDSGLAKIQFGIKPDATSNRYHEFRITSISDADIYETSLQMITHTPTNYIMLVGNIGIERGAQLSLGDANWDSLSIYAATDVIGNASYVYVADTSDHVKKIPVSSFGGGGSGTVTSVGLSMPNIFSVSNSPVTTSGTLTATLVSQTKNHVFAAPSTVNGTPSFRALVSADIPDLSSQYDFYGSWKIKTNSDVDRYILKTGGIATGEYYNELRITDGVNMAITGKGAGSALSLVFNASITSNTAYLDLSPATILSSTWSTITASTGALKADLYASGWHFIIGQVSLVRSSNASSILAARLIDSNSVVIASSELGVYSSNRATFTVSGVVWCERESPHWVALEIYANTTGWSAIPATATSGNSAKATQITAIRLTI